MPVDTSIYGNLLRPPKSVLEYGAEMDAADMQRQQAQLGQMNLLQQRQAIDDDRALRGLYADPSFKADSPDAVNRVIAAAGPKAGYALQKQMLDAQKGKADIQETTAKTVKLNAEAAAERIKQFRGALDFVDTPQGAARWLQAQFNDPALADTMNALGTFEQAVTRIPQDPAAFQQWRQQAAMGMEKHLQEERLKAENAEKARHNKTTETETGRHNKAEEGISGGNLNVARKNASLREQELDFNRNQPKGILTQTDQGPVLADPRTGESRPLTMNGEKLGPKLTQVPASANTAIISNGQNLSKIQQAIDLIDGKDVGALKGDKNATGVKGYLPNGLLNRLDAKGVDARAMIADIGSLIIHDRSGAAVTAAESPRLMPFIPLATDDKETARKKLVRFKQLYEQESKGLEQAYSRDAGYNTKPPKAEGGLSPSEQAELDALRKRFQR